MYWEKPGRDNTEESAKLAVAAAIERGIKDIVVASNEGDTVFALLKQDGAADLNIICVTHQVGFKEPGLDEMGKETRKDLTERGVKVYTSTHLLSGVDRSLRKSWGGTYPPEIIANTLRLFGEGIKVCVEISVMALDAGLIPYGKDVIAVGGTGRGADTVAIIRPAHSRDFFESRIGEIICRPSA